MINKKDMIETFSLHAIELAESERLNADAIRLLKDTYHYFMADEQFQGFHAWEKYASESVQKWDDREIARINQQESGFNLEITLKHQDWRRAIHQSVITVASAINNRSLSQVIKAVQNLVGYHTTKAAGCTITIGTYGDQLAETMRDCIVANTAEELPAIKQSQPAESAVDIWTKTQRHFDFFHSATIAGVKYLIQESNTHGNCKVWYTLDVDYDFDRARWIKIILDDSEDIENIETAKITAVTHAANDETTEWRSQNCDDLYVQHIARINGTFYRIIQCNEPEQNAVNLMYYERNTESTIKNWIDCGGVEYNDLDSAKLAAVDFEGCKKYA